MGSIAILGPQHPLIFSLPITFCGLAQQEKDFDPWAVEEVLSDIISETMDPPNVIKGQSIIVIGHGRTLALALSY